MIFLNKFTKLYNYHHKLILEHFHHLVNGIILHVVSCLWSLWLTIVFLRFIYVVCVSILHFFWLLNRSQWIDHISFIPSQLGGHLIVSIFCRLWIILLWSFMYSSSYGHMFLFLLTRFLGVEVLSHMINLLLTFLKNCNTLFHSYYITFWSHSHVWRL